MSKTLRTDWWRLVATAIAGAIAALGLVHAGGFQAAGQASEVELSRQQLLINQRISQAAVRRSNSALDRLPDWAVVLATGELVRSSGNVSVTRTGPGLYQVDFNRDLTECAFTASQIQPNPQLIGNTGLAVDGDLQTLAVQTTDPTGAAADRNFTVQVTC